MVDYKIFANPQQVLQELAIINPKLMDLADGLGGDLAGTLSVLARVAASEGLSKPEADALEDFIQRRRRHAPAAFLKPFCTLADQIRGHFSIRLFREWRKPEVCYRVFSRPEAATWLREALGCPSLTNTLCHHLFRQVPIKELTYQSHLNGYKGGYEWRGRDYAPPAADDQSPTEQSGQAGDTPPEETANAADQVPDDSPRARARERPEKPRQCGKRSIQPMILVPRPETPEGYQQIIP